MQIENVGFYETRDGDLRYAMGRIPDVITSDYQWIVFDVNGGLNEYTYSGYFSACEREDGDDLIRYLPTVKSWSDPIPPPEPPAVTVYTEWLSVGEDGNRWTGWTMDGAKPCYAVAKLRTVEVPANE